MYVEELKNDKFKGVWGFVLIAVIVFGILGLMYVAGFLNYWLNVNFFQFILLAIVFIAAFFIIKYVLTEYIYVLHGDRLVIGRRLGKREKELLMIPYRGIDAHGTLSSLDGKFADYKKVRFTFKKITPDTYYIAAAGKTALIDVSEKFIEKLKEKA